MSKFTSGKWEIHDTKPYMIKAPGSPFLALAVSLSDARLIAAAPEMYRLLEETLRFFSEHDIDSQLKLDIDYCLCRVDGSPLQSVYDKEAEA